MADVEFVIPDGTKDHDAFSVQGCGPVKIIVGKNARVCIVQHVTADCSTEVVVHSGADVEFISEQTSDPAGHLTITQRASVGDNATIRWRNVTLGAGTVEHNLRSELTGDDAVSEVDWMFYAKHDEKYHLTARNVFLGKRGGGEMTMKGVAEQRGHVKCDGMIEIGKGGAGTDTYLTQDVLMLDKTSKVDAIPGLEIKTNDVRASHSATVSRVTDEDLFYFAARGIAEREARRMFVEGFLGEMVTKIGDEAVRQDVLAAVETKYS
ncbi:MAG: SufD family Fe-S cluster assembly protein [Candidatus Peribacteraceae bacterium]|nr:SufD family Fe-S cluster assembly protein [Candidatus Peribacteraceae bacterium]